MNRKSRSKTMKSKRSTITKALTQYWILTFQDLMPWNLRCITAVDWKFTQSCQKITFLIGLVDMVNGFYCVTHSLTFFYNPLFFRWWKNHGAKRAPIMYWRRNKFSLTDQLISVMGILAVDKNFFNTMISLFYRLPDDWVEKVLSCVFAAVAFSCEKTEVRKKKKPWCFCSTENRIPLICRRYSIKFHEKIHNINDAGKICALWILLQLYKPQASINKITIHRYVSSVSPILYDLL